MRDESYLNNVGNLAARRTDRSSYYQKVYCPQPRSKKKEHRLEKLVRIFSKLKGETLLDLGCSDGQITDMICRAMNPQEAFALDLSEIALKKAVTFGVNVVQCDFDRLDLPFRDNCFDVIYIGDVVEHLFNPSHLFEEIKRVLKPKGKCVLTTPNLASWSNRLLLLFGYQPFLTNADFQFGYVGKLGMLRNSDEIGRHIRPFTFRALKELIIIHGFKIESVSGASMGLAEPRSFLGRLTNSLDRFLCSRPSWATHQVFCFSKPN